MDNSFSSVIDSATSILVLLPTKPYFDQVAAGLSLYLSLHDKKDVSISCPSPMMVGFNRLIGVNKIVEQVGNKNLVIRFSDYDATNIEKVSYDIENGEFKLTVTPKSGFKSPQKEQLDLSYAGAACDLIILVGGANETHFPSIEMPDLGHAKLLHIGTRVLSTSREVMSFAKPGASTSEIVAGLIKDNGLSIDPDIATNLVMGIEEGSSNFSSPEVKPETFELFAYLLRSGGQRLPKTRLSPASFPVGAIPTQPFAKPRIRPVEPEEVPMSENIDASDFESTQETEQEMNPPDDWLQPKVFKGSAVNPSESSFSENKG